MTHILPSSFKINPAVAEAITKNKPVVALESAVVTHGLPRPKNLELARALEEEVRRTGVTPATIALLSGKVMVGLEPVELEQLANMEKTRKISRRDFGIAVARGESGGTTVAGTLVAAHAAGIRVFATGGIGGVHRDPPTDISADLPELAHTPLIVVCSGAKSILNLPATIEYLETVGVPIVGYQTDEFPAFFSRSSGLQVNVRVESPAEAAQIALRQWEMGIQSAVLVVQPPPASAALPADAIEAVIDLALQEAREEGIHGASATPFLLEKVNQLSHGASLEANLALLKQNARLAAQIALALSLA